MSLGPELVVNGGFDTDPAVQWILGDSWYWQEAENSSMIFVGGIGGVLSQELSVGSQKKFRITFTISNYNHTGALSLTVSLFDVVNNITGDGDYSFDTTTITDSDPVLSFTVPSGESFIFNLDDVSVKEIIDDSGGGIFMDIFDELWAD